MSLTADYNHNNIYIKTQSTLIYKYNTVSIIHLAECLQIPKEKKTGLLNKNQFLFMFIQIRQNMLIASGNRFFDCSASHKSLLINTTNSSVSQTLK